MNIGKKFFCSTSFLALFTSFCFATPPKIQVRFMEKNPCFTQEKRLIQPKGIMVHSTAEPGIMAKDWFDLWNIPVEQGGREVGVHAFVDDKDIIQYLPWEKRAWHCGRGEKGSYNDTHISIEMCEPEGIEYTEPGTIADSYNPEDPVKKKYFNSALKNMVELCAHLVQTYKIDLNNIICHQEGYQQGMASDHKDVLHWWPRHGVEMDTFRSLVGKKLKGKTISYNF